MKISINLLPIEFKEENLKNSRFYLVQSIGIICILSIFFLASLSVALRVLQSQNISQIQASLSQAENKISALNEVQAAIFILKNRLTTIKVHLTTPSQQSQAYRLVQKTLPSSVSLNSLSIDKNLEVLVLVTSPDGRSIDTFINNLTDRQLNENRISQVSVENFNRGQDSIYRVSLRIKLAPL